MTYTKQQWVDGQTKVDAQHLNHIEEGISAVEAAIPDTSSFVTTDQVYTKEQIDSKISSVMSYKGTVATEAELPAQANIGDVYNVTDTGMNYAWNGSQWDALGSDIDLSNYVTNTQFETELAKKQPAGDYATVEQLNTQLAEKQPVGDYATTQELNVGLATKQEVGDYPVYQKFSAGADPTERKTIQLANADSISGLSTSGGGANLIMLSKWDKVDIGSVNYQMNLNSPSGVVQINDEKVVATTDQIPDESQFVNIDVYNEDKAGLQTAIDSKQPVGDYALNSALEPLATKEAVASLKVVDLGTFDKVEGASYAAGADGVYNNKEAVVLTFDTAEGSGVIFNTMTAVNSSAQRLYWNNQVLSRTVTDGSGTGWGVLSNFTELQNRAIKSTLFTLTTDADSETIKAAMTNENSKTITASDLDSCLKYGYTIRDYALQSGSIFVGWTGSAYTLTYIGFASPTSESYVMSIVVNVTPEGEYSIIRNGARGQILTSSNLASNKTFAAVADVAPVIVNINLRDSKLTTEVQEKATILGWFGVTTDVELKQLIASTRPMFVRYGISLSTNPHYYKMPIEYIAYESATQLKMVFSGLDTSNDQPVRYTIVANLDGTPIEEGGNVSMVLEPIDTQADIDQLATKQELSESLAGKQDKGDYATNEVVQAEFESYDKTIKTYIEQQVTSKADQVEVDSLDSRVDVVESISGSVYTMQSQIAQLVDQVQQLKTPTVEPVEISVEQPSVEQPDRDVSFNAVVNGTVGTITAKSIQSTNASIQSGRLAATATNDVSIKNLSTSGDLAKSIANAGLSVNTDDYVTITGADWQQTGYNGIEVGLSSAPKSILIDGVDFKAAMSNNAISIFSWQENAVITISNCHFANVSNPLRLSNRDNKPCTVNIVNCTCDQWVAGEYAGFICMQDYTSSSAQVAQEANQFGKLIINFVNCSGPDGRIVGNAQQLAENHIIYVYTDQEGLIAFGDGSRYPTVTAQ